MVRKRSEKIKLIYGAITVVTAIAIFCVVMYRRSYVWASWYGPHFQGQRTASGEIFNMYKMTAASRTLPLGSIIEVTNCKTDKSVCVRVNDRGPYKMNSRGEPLYPLRPHPYRGLDLSYAAAKKIGMLKRGVARVKIEVVSRESDVVKERRI